MPAIAIDDIVTKILDGIVQAQNNYAEWSGGDWLSDAPEYMLNIHIAQKITRMRGSKYLTLEHYVKSAMDDARAVERGRVHSKIRAEGSVDMLLWWDNETPRAVIEVKNKIGSVVAIKGDLERISGILQRNKKESSFQCGVMAYYTSCYDSKGISAKEHLKRRIDDIEKGAVELLEGKNKVKSYNKKIRVEEDSAWTAAALLIK